MKVNHPAATGEAHLMGKPPLLHVNELVDGYYFAAPTEELNFAREELNFAREQLNYSCTRAPS